MAAGAAMCGHRMFAHLGARLLHLPGDLVDRQRDLDRADLFGRHASGCRSTLHISHGLLHGRRRAALREPVRHVLEPAGDRDRGSLRGQGGQGAADDRDQVATTRRSSHPRLLYGAEDDVPDGDFEIPFGQADVKREGDDVTIVACSMMTVGGARRRRRARRGGHQCRGDRPPHPGAARREDDPRLGRQDRAAGRRRRGPDALRGRLGDRRDREREGARFPEGAGRPGGPHDAPVAANQIQEELHRPHSGEDRLGRRGRSSAKCPAAAA